MLVSGSCGASSPRPAQPSRLSPHGSSSGSDGARRATTDGEDPDRSWTEAVAWAAAVGVGAGVARVLAVRGAARGWERVKGDPTPDLRRRRAQHEEEEEEVGASVPCYRPDLIGPAE